MLFTQKNENCSLEGSSIYDIGVKSPFLEPSFLE